MPTIRVTIASNAQQSQRAPLIISSSTSFDPASSASCRSFVFKYAQAKLRLRKASRVFVSGGRELIHEEDWRDELKDDVLLLISAGENYVGSKSSKGENSSTQDVGENSRTKGPSQAGNPQCSITILADKVFVDTTSITQLKTTARTLPGIIQAVGQPDLHPGTKFPIGAVFISEGWIHPPLIGGDIGCGMAWYKTKLSRAQVEGAKGRKVAEKLRGLEGAWRTHRDRQVWLDGEADTEGESCVAGETWDVALGTIGAGNHFGELQVVEEAPARGERSGTALSQYQLYEGEVILLVHSGSRGYGGDILKRYTEGGRTSIHEDEPIAKSYLSEHDRACSWASRNRDLIALRFLACLEPGDEAWKLGINDTDSPPTAPSQVSTALQSIQTRKVVDIWHNNVEITSWPPLPPTTTSSPKPSLTPSQEQQSVFIHRKGAAPTHSPDTSRPLPLLPLPGSRATPTLILRPTFSASTSYGAMNGLSLAHGAGRAMSRAKASTSVAQKYYGKAEDLLRGDFVKSDGQGNKLGVGGESTIGGTWVVCEDKQLVWEEAGEAYKDVWDVGGDLVRAGVAERIGWCKGVVSYKVRKE